MRNKCFLWTVFLIILFMFFIMPVFSDEEETVDNMLDEVYLGRSNKIEDESAVKGTINNPVTTFAEAFGIVKNGGTIAMLDEIKWKDSDKKAMEERSIDFIIIDGKGNGSKRCKIGYELQGTTPKPIMFAACKGITLVNVESEGTIYARGSPLVIKGESKLATVYGGSRELDVVEGNTSITLESGTIKNIYGGSRDNTLIGNTVINIKGGTVEGNIISGGNSVDKATFVTGDSTINIIGDANLKPNVISTNCISGAVGGVRTINIKNSKIEVEKICDANELNIISSEVTAKKFELGNNISLVENINIDKESTFIANSGNEYRIKGKLSGNGKLVLNNESSLLINEVDEDAKITIKTNKPYHDKEGNLHDLLIQTFEKLLNII